MAATDAPAGADAGRPFWQDLLPPGPPPLSPPYVDAYPVRLPENVDRDDVIRRLAEGGIPAKAYLPAIHLLPHLREHGYAEGDFPEAEALAARSLALPFHAGLGESDVTRVAEALDAALTA